MHCLPSWWHSEALATTVMLMFYLWLSILGFAPRCAMDAFGWLYHSEDPLYSNRLGKSLAYSRILQRSCTRLSSLLKCGKWSNWTSHSCTRESRWPRQALLSWQGYSKQKFFKQRFSQQTVLSQFSLGWHPPVHPSCTFKSEVKEHYFHHHSPNYLPLPILWAGKG